jgi:hypothetical protein
MTDKEKAKEIIDKYIDIMPNLENQTGVTILRHAIECAVVAVDEIISELNSVAFNYELDFNKTLLFYWQEVKQELETFKITK